MSVNILFDFSYNQKIYLVDTFNMSLIDVYESNKKDGLVFDLYTLLELNKVSIDQISRVVSVSGPGRYTALRQSYVLKEIFSLVGVPTSSYVSYELPYFLGVENYIWCNNSFKGEFCVYERSSGEEIKKYFIKNFEELKVNSKIPVYTYDESLKKYLNQLHVIDLDTFTRKNLAKILSKSDYGGSVASGILYYRDSESEFSRAS